VLSEVAETDTSKNGLRKMMANYLRRLIMTNKEFILEEVLAVKGLMQLLMKQRNMNQEWTKEEIKEIRKHLKNISKVAPALLIFLLPGGSLLLPLFAEILDRRKTIRPPIRNP
jgi:cob(I)alamin adenosyltransferase